ncbi:cell wall-associated NlpC family hydrolase [Curtobacterium flaccumfaciens]|uniref:Cell wall-associated NlpC family hydrolase n=1 Tax=Curtobacterium salicis TaxID=1779862 RepID=A0ABX0T362_9MICO|nr:C40 family peptidase [Curtobacterium sp. WW7]NII39916.1 cell wall-associated NlpC family hydrolase [Curtobacterium sp. WW7]
MSIDAVLSRISEIRSQIETLQSGSGAPSAASSAAASSAFADALATETGTGTGTGTATGAAAGASTAGAAGTAAPAGAATAAPATSVDAGRDTLATGSGATGDAVVAAAEKYLGVPYVFGGETRAGMDCSGLVQTVFKDLGVTMPRVVPDQADMGVAVPSLAQAQPGDLIIPKGEGHIVIYVGDGKVLHAPHPGKDVRIVDNWYKDSDIATIRRIVPSGQEAAATAAAQAARTVGTSSTTNATDLQMAALQSMLTSGSVA